MPALMPDLPADSTGRPRGAPGLAHITAKLYRAMTLA